MAATSTAVGFAYDAGSGTKELSAVFTVFYVAGCLLAVLAVRQSGVFTAVIQPALILFVSVPTAYYLFNSSEIAGIKDVLINCGYPLIERFPMMFFTSAVVLIIGLARWYLSLSSRRGIAADDESGEPEKPEKPKRARRTADETTVLDAVEETPRRRTRERARPADRSSRAAAVADEADDAPRRPARSPRPAPAAGTSRSRHARPPDTDLSEPTPRPRRRPGPPVDPDARPRTRTASSREPRRNLPPIDSPTRGSYDRPERRERPRRAEYDRPERSEPRRRRAADYDSHDSYDGFEQRPTNGSHHPVSRVRYRGDDNLDSGEPESRPRPRRPYNAADADSWEYDV